MDYLNLGPKVLVLIKVDLFSQKIERTWGKPQNTPCKEDATLSSFFLDSLIILMRWIDTHLAHGLLTSIGQIHTSLEQLRIET
mgnify:CR=1 FL=1